MKFWWDSLFTCILSLTESILPTSGCKIYHFVSTNHDRALEGHAIKFFEKPLLNFCWHECSLLPWCFSINVRQMNKGTFQCELNNSSKKANLSKIVNRQGWSYYEMKGLYQNNCKLYECVRKEDLGNGWYRYGDAAIKLFTEKKNWTDSRSHCQSLGGDLLSITSSHENDFVNDVFIENLNLTYVQKDKKFDKPFVYIKLNGNESEARSLGEYKDVSFRINGREKALYMNGKKGNYAEITPIQLNEDEFSVCLWINPSKPINSGTTLQISNIILFWGTAGHMQFNVNDIFLGSIRLQLNQWQHLSFTWYKNRTKFSYGRNGLWGQIDESKILSIKDVANGNKIQFGHSSKKTFQGFIKHLVIVNSSLPARHIQTIMHWHEQGVWIGLHNPQGSSVFKWSDGTPVGNFMNLPDYNPEPAQSGRKCVAMASDDHWLDKHCDLKYPYLCEKPAPP